MTRFQLRPLAIALALALALVPAACGARHDDGAQSSITMKLPPARPPGPRPGFSLDAPARAAQPGDEGAAEAVHQLAALR